MEPESYCRVDDCMRRTRTSYVYYLAVNKHSAFTGVHPVCTGTPPISFKINLLVRRFNINKFKKTLTNNILKGQLYQFETTFWAFIEHYLLDITGLQKKHNKIFLFSFKPHSHSLTCSIFLEVVPRRQPGSLNFKTVYFLYSVNTAKHEFSCSALKLDEC